MRNPDVLGVASLLPRPHRRPLLRGRTTRSRRGRSLRDESQRRRAVAVFGTLGHRPRRRAGRHAAIRSGRARVGASRHSSGKGGHPALRNKLVRRALAYGIDRVAIVRALFGAVGPKLRPLDSAVLRSGDRFYAPNWSGYRYDPGHARRLLNEAGCRRGEDGIYSCAGVRLSLRFVSRGAGDRRVRTLELVQAELRQAGVEVVPLYSSAHDQVLESGDFDVTLFAWFGGGAEDGGINSLYGCGGEQNYTGYCQRLVTGDLDQSRSNLPPYTVGTRGEPRRCAAREGRSRDPVVRGADGSRSQDPRFATSCRASSTQPGRLRTGGSTR